ncbi:MAG: sensor histidine kinase [Sphingobium sp.]
MLGGLAAVFISPPRDIIFSHTSFVVAALSVYLTCAGLVLTVAAALRTALLRLQAAHEHEQTLNLELRHRIKNFLTVIQSLASQTARTAPDPETFHRTFKGRLEAYQMAMDLVAQNDWRLFDLPTLPKTILAPFQMSGQIALQGPACKISAQAAEGLALILHELATNALKYGALSAPGGRVELAWTPLASKGSRNTCELIWSEHGGPPVMPPTRQGLGSRLIRPQRGIEKVELQFLPDGVVCTLLLAMAERQEDIKAKQSSARHFRPRVDA